MIIQKGFISPSRDLLRSWIMSSKSEEMRAALAKAKTELETEQNKMREARQKEANARARTDLEYSRSQEMAKELDEAVAMAKREGFGEGGKTHMEQADHLANNLIHQAVTTINDWRAIMSSLVNLYLEMNMAYTAKATQFFVETKQKYISPLWNGLTGNPVGKIDPENPPLPTFRHNVTFTPDGTLNIASLIRSDDAETSQPLDDFFRKGIVLWLEQAGYKETAANSGKFVGIANTPQSGQPLTKIAFDALKADPVKGLKQFLTAEAPELTFEQAPPTPGM